MNCRELRISLLVLLVTLPLAAQTQTPQPSHTAVKRDAKNNVSSSNEAEIRELYDRWAKAFRVHDLDGIMSVYAPGDEVIGYDIVPPLQYVGKDKYRKDYEEFLSQYQGPIDIEYRDLRIIAGDNVAFIHALERMSGTLKNGQKSDLWVRATSGLRKIDGKWLIVHDHISVPADFETGKAVLDLKP
jgi:uncharacterized protein (TIGR02246 family)